MDTAVIPANHPYPSLKRRGCPNVIPAAFSPDVHREGIQSYTRLTLPLIGVCLSLLLGLAPAFAATTDAPKPSGVSPAGKDVLRFLGDTANRAGLAASPDPDADNTDVYDIIAAIINTVLGLTGIIFFIQVFWAGFRWMTAGGAEETITTAKKTIVSSVIGIAIALSAFVITNFVLNKIEEINKGGGGTTAPTTPTGTGNAPEQGACWNDEHTVCQLLTASGCEAISGSTWETGNCPAETVGWCRVVIATDATGGALWGDCYQATQQECINDAQSSDPGEERSSWGTEQASTCDNPTS